MKMKGVEWICRELVCSPYCIGLCLDEDQFKQELKKMKVPKDHWPEWTTNGKPGTVHFFEKTSGHGYDLCCIVCVKPGERKDPTAIPGLLIHEAVHIWQHICIDLGEDRPSKEFEAYSIQAIAQRLIAAYSEMTAKPKKKK
jgi:hypothetical protein